MSPLPNLPRRRWLASLGLLPLLQACSPLSLINATVPTGTHRAIADQIYGPDPRHRLDVYLPPSPVSDAPAVLFFYGGTWSSGRRQDYRFVGEALASRGIVALVADYRLSPQVSYPSFVQDSALALRWAWDRVERLGASPGRLFVMGHSAGAYNAAMLALDARWLKGRQHAPQELAGWIGLAGPYDFLPIVNSDVKPVFHHPTYPPHSQAIDFALPGSPPSFVAAAEKDSLVNPQRNSAQMAARLQAVDVPVSYHVYPRANHVTLAGAFARPLRWIAPVLDDVVAFIEQTPPVKPRS